MSQWESTLKGMPDLDDLLAGALDIALGFVEGVDKVQDWLKTPLLSQQQQHPHWSIHPIGMIQILQFTNKLS